MEDGDNTHARTYASKEATITNLEKNQFIQRVEEIKTTGIHHLREITMAKLKALALPGVGQDVGERTSPTLLLRTQTGPAPVEGSWAICG